MEAQLNLHRGITNYADCAIFINIARESWPDGDVIGVQLEIADTSDRPIAIDTVVFTMSLAEARLLVDRLLRAIGDKV